LRWVSTVSIFDFDIVCVNAVNPPQRLTNDLYSFLKDGGILCAFVSGANSQCLQPFIAADANHSGKKIGYCGNSQNRWLVRLLSNAEYEFGWSAVLRKGERTTSFEEIAYSPNRKCVCAIARLAQGVVIGIPTPVSNLSSILRRVLDDIKSNFVQDDEQGAPPECASAVLLPGEQPLLDDIGKIEESLSAKRQELSILAKPKEILHLSGERLSQAVCELLLQMGVDASYREERGRQDIEIRLGDLVGLVEVKGLKGYANVDDVRQLLDWYIDAGGLSTGLKGIFILNHYRGLEPDAREEPYTPDALRLGTTNHFCLMTTVDLLAIYKRHALGEESSQDAMKNIFDTEGLFARNP